MGEPWASPAPGTSMMCLLLFASICGAVLWNRLCCWGRMLVFPEGFVVLDSGLVFGMVDLGRLWR